MEVFLLESKHELVKVQNPADKLDHAKKERRIVRRLRFPLMRSISTARDSCKISV